MKDYIKFYKYDADYQAAKPNLPEPHAVYCWETNIVDISAPVFNEKQYFALKAVDGDATLTITNKDGAAPQLWYSYDQENWTDWTADGYPEVTIYNGKKVYLKGNNDQMGYTVSKYSQFGGTGKYEASGSISSLLNGDDIFGNLTLSKTYSFFYLFNENTALISAKDLTLPYTGLTESCYYCMFRGCTSLSSAPELPATTLAKTCYYGMFYNCTSLTVAPALPATTIANGCYSNMFYGCTSLTVAPALPATTLDMSCYSNMFRGCSALTQAPALPATTLVYNCYYYMFQNCTSLTTATIHIADFISGNYCNYMFSYCIKLNEIILPNCTSFVLQSSWVTGVSSTGVCKCLRVLTDIPRGASGIPTNWTIEYLD